MFIVHTEASCGWGGQEIRILEEADALRARGHRVELVCPAHAGIFVAARQRGLIVHAIGLDRRTPANVWRLRRLLARLAPDVVNTHSSADSWLTAVARVVQTLLGGRRWPIVRTRHISAPVGKNAATRWLYASGADHIVTTGEALRLSLQHDLRLPPERLTSIPTGVDPTRFQPHDPPLARRALALDPDIRLVGIAATLRSWKGHLDLLAAWQTLAPGHSGWRLLIVGDGPMREKIDTFVATHGLHDTVLLVGQQSRPEDYLAAMDVFCLPSYANEGVPQAIVQAMLCALPIVTTPVGAILEAVTHAETALVVPPRDVPAIAAALAELMRDAGLRQRLGQNARHVAAARFTREAMADRMAALFVSVMATRSAVTRATPAAIPEPASILVIVVTRIGDTLFTTPAIRAIAQHWPRARLTILGHPTRYEVLQNFPGAAQVGSIEKNRARWKNLLSRKQHDLAFVYGFDAALVAYALRSAQKVVAFEQPDPRLNSRLWRCVAPPLPGREHAVDQALRLPQALNIPVASRRLLYRPLPDELGWAGHLIARAAPAKTPLIGIQMASFATKAYRDWPPEHFLAVAQALRRDEPAAHFFILGGPEEHARTSWLHAQLPDCSTLVAGRLSLRQTGALMSRLDLYLGVDTGPTHLMSCFDRPMVALYHSRSPSWRVGPLEHPCGIWIDHPMADPAGQTDPLADAVSMAAISVERVLSACRTQLAAYRHARDVAAGS
jgi:glycosyltransferase involved in cell wall biosynthesis/ADP-heptose:LPS heptosyltransferase